MKIRNVELKTKPPADRDLCSWSNCYATPGHTASFEVEGGSKNRRRWFLRTMALCDKHRGAFKRKHLGGSRRG